MPNGPLATTSAARNVPISIATGAAVRVEDTLGMAAKYNRFGDLPVTGLSHTCAKCKNGFCAGTFSSNGLIYCRAVFITSFRTNIMLAGAMPAGMVIIVSYDTGACPEFCVRGIS